MILVKSKKAINQLKVLLFNEIDTNIKYWLY